MNNRKWNYKNFNMAHELDIAGEFIYNGIHEIYKLNVIANDAPTFSALYNLAVGIERLQKIVIVLWSVDAQTELSEFETKIATHMHSDLRDRIIKCTQKSNQSKMDERENAFITMIQSFYSRYRYNNFNADYNPLCLTELFYNFLKKYCNLNNSFSINYQIVIDESIKEFIGRVIGKISRNYYALVEEGSRNSNTFSYELRSDSKAEKVFLQPYRKNSLMNCKEKEKIAFKELIVYLVNTQSTAPDIEYIRKIKPLDFDPPLIDEYLDEISKGHTPQALIDDVDAQYDLLDFDSEQIKERTLYLTGVGNPLVDFVSMYFIEFMDEIYNIISSQTINNEQLSNLLKFGEYLDDTFIKIPENYENLALYIKKIHNENANNCSEFIKVLVDLRKQYIDSYNRIKSPTNTDNQ